MRVDLDKRGPEGSKGEEGPRKSCSCRNGLDIDAVLLLRSTGMEESSQKLFRLPGTIEEEEEEERKEVRPAREVLENALRAESPLLGHKVVAGVLSSLPRNVTLVRVSTQSSSIAGGVCRQDSTR